MPDMPVAPPPLAHLTAVFGRIGLLSFGGPAAQIALMHRELVEERPWLSEAQFLSALSFCMMLPGPEAMQLATYAGWRLRGVAGGLIGGLLFVLPGAVVVGLLACAYGLWGALPLAAALFLGIKAVVVVVVAQALLRLAGKALQSRDRWVIAALSFAAIFAFGAPFPLIIAAAAAYGAWRAPLHPVATRLPLPAPGATLRRAGALLVLWWAPMAGLWLAGATHLTAIGLFFSKLAIVTFGGAYAVLAYMAQEVVSRHAWVSTAQMLDGLGLAETTPGPLILVTEFIGYLAGFGAGGVGLGLAAALLTLWVTFVPCFLWIFAGAPYIDWVASRPRLSGALSAITAAVVGVILNLSLWFALHVFFTDVGSFQAGALSLPRPNPASLDLRALALAGLAALLLIRLRLPLPAVLVAMALAGAALAWV